MWTQRARHWCSHQKPGQEYATQRPLAQSLHNRLSGWSEAWVNESPRMKAPISIRALSPTEEENTPFLLVCLQLFHTPG
jgi:hypothetical protein